MKNPELFAGRPQNDPTCSVLNVAPWVWDMIDLGREIAERHVGMNDIDAFTYQLALTTWSAVHDAKGAAETTDEKRRATVRQAAAATRGNNV